MSSEDFIVRIADLDAGPQHLQQPITGDWLARALADTEATPWRTEEDEASVGEVDLEVTKSGRQILVRGQIRARVTLACARTLDPAHYDLESQVFLLLDPAAGEGQPASRSARTPRAHRTARADRTPGKSSTDTGAAPKKGKRRGGDWSEDPELTEERAATDTYSGELLHLDEFIREFIVLEFPMFPLREDLRSDADRASSALPSGAEATQLDGDRPLDPRLSPLVELKARLEKKE